MTIAKAGCVAAILAGAQLVSATPLPDVWLPIQHRLASGDVAGAVEELEDLRSAAAAVQAERLTPYARSVVAASSSLDNAGAIPLLEAAIRLDPQLASPRFALAGRQWATGAYGAATVQHLRAWWALLADDESRRGLLRSMPVWLLLGAGFAMLTVVGVQSARTLRRLAFDALWLGRSVFDHSNGWVFAAVLLVLPVFAGLDAVWVAVYLAAMGWIYLAPGQRAVAIVSLVCLALVVPALEGWQQLALHRTPLPTRIGDMVRERRVDLSTLRELLTLKSEFDDVEAYHLVTGELYRLHGEIDQAREQFQQAVIVGGTRPEPLVFLGNLAQEEGDIHRSIQLYNRAIEVDARSALAYHNLSSAYDGSRRFQEGDQARSIARELAGGRSSTIGLGAPRSRLRYPRLTESDVDQMVAAAPDAAKVQLSEPRSADLVRGFLSPLSLVFWVASVIGVAVFVVRVRWYGPARECTKCGKVFRAEDMEEGSIYCQQCVSVYLRRERVSIDQQSAKGRQVERWERAGAVARRVTGILVPGGYHTVSRDPWTGFALAVGFWVAVVGAGVWTPLFLPGVEPQVRTEPLTVILASTAGLLWLTSAVGSWYRR